MLKRILGVLAVMGTTAAATAVAAGWFFGREVLPERATLITVHSTVLSEERELIVHVPEEYEREADRKFPVVYVLDGSSQDLHTSTTAALMARINLMPKVIVVGIANVGARGRQRDYTPPFGRQDEDEASSPLGQADRFLAFLKTEVVPEVERRYRTSGDRMLAGHSRGGLFVVWSLMADPSLFQARFANSPALWRDDTAVAGHLREFLGAHPDLGGFLYMSMGTGEVPRMKAAFDQVRSVLAASSPASFAWVADDVPGSVHANNGEWATPRGFQVYFNR